MSEASVPTLVSEDAVTPEARVLPDKLPALIFMFAVPSNDVPAIVLAVSRAVAVAALPEVSWLPEVLTPGRLILAVPSKETPPMFLAVAKAVAVAALPVISLSK